MFKTTGSSRHPINSHPYSYASNSLLFHLCLHNKESTVHHCNHFLAKIFQLFPLFTSMAMSGNSYKDYNITTLLVLIVSAWILDCTLIEATNALWESYIISLVYFPYFGRQLFYIYFSIVKPPLLSDELTSHYIDIIKNSRRKTLIFHYHDLHF